MRERCCFFLLIIVLNFKCFAETPLQELLTLTQYKVIEIGGGKMRVFHPKTNKEIFDYSVVEAAEFLPLYEESRDTLMLDQSQFPHLKSATFKGTFFNQLLEISKIKTLEYLDISALSRGDFNMNSYKLFFPPTFWSHNNLQVLIVTADQLSDISENIEQLKQLKVLNIYAHEGTEQLILPWSLLFHEQIRVLGLPLDLVYQQEDVVLFESQASFNVLSNNQSYVLLKSIALGEATLIERRPMQIDVKNNRLLLQNDSLQLTIPLLSDGQLAIDGVAILKKNGVIVQKRNYTKGSANGKWLINDAIAKQIRKYTNNIPVGRWKFLPKVDNYSKQVIHFSNHGANVKINAILFRKLIYKNYNEHLYFSEPVE